MTLSLEGKREYILGAALFLVAAVALCTVLADSDGSDALYTGQVIDDDKGNQYRYTGGTAVEFCGYYGFSSKVNVPSTVEYESTTYDVTGVGSEAIQDDKNVYSVTLPDSVTYIGAHAFSNCSKMSTVKVGSGLATIGYEAFANSRGFYSINLQDSTSLATIEDRAFYGCKSLSSLTLPASLTTLGEDVFGNCTKLTSVSVEGSPNFKDFKVEGYGSSLGIVSTDGTVLYALWYIPGGPKDIFLTGVTIVRCSMTGNLYEKIGMTGNGVIVMFGLKAGTAAPSGALAFDLNGKDYSLTFTDKADVPAAVKDTAGAYSVYTFLPELPEGVSGSFTVSIRSDNQYYTPYVISDSGERSEIEYTYSGGYYNVTVSDLTYLALMADTESLIPNAQDIGIFLIVAGTILAVIVAVINHRRYGA